jgi:hypothetical protein
LGGVTNLVDTSTQPSHTPVSETVLGSTFLGSTFLSTNIPNNSPIIPPSQGGGAQPSSQGISSQPSSQGNNPQPQHTMAGTPPSMPYLESLKIPYLTKLMNDPILHDPTWPNMPTKLPFDIPKFEGKMCEDPANHIMSFHLWCSSNNIMEYSICLILFQRTLTGPSAKWYVDEKLGSHVTFGIIGKILLILLSTVYVVMKLVWKFIRI